MKNIFYKSLTIIRRIHSKIVFYPTVFALMGILAALLMFYLEEQGISQYLLDIIPALVVDNGNTALTILSALITGLISMMVFSFSMVMLLLSQASSNFSPRLLPGLISDKTHQLILGVYLGTILYNIFILFSIQPTGDQYQVPGFSVLLGILFTVLCIYAFIYFIHNISESIQISKILDQIYSEANIRISEIIKEEDQEQFQFVSTIGWSSYASGNSGYLQSVTFTNLIEICEKENIKIYIPTLLGMFVYKEKILFQVNRKIDEEVHKRILSNFHFSRGELVKENYVFAFKQITEIILKAMSPGINDPGTAINGIDYLSELFSLRLQKRDDQVFGKNGEALLKIETVKFKDLLYQVMAAIRTYCKHDVVLLQKLILMLQHLKIKAVNNMQYECIEEEIKALESDAKQALTNERDLQKISGLIKRQAPINEIAQSPETKK